MNKINQDDIVCMPNKQTFLPRMSIVCKKISIILPFLNNGFYITIVALVSSDYTN